MNIRFYHARLLLLSDDDSFFIQEGELWVRGSRIAHIGSGNEKREEEPVWDREIDVEGNLLMPGFKNAHTHTAMTFLRSYADDMPLQEWLHQQVFPKEALLTEEDVYHLCKLGIMEYLTSGITSNFDMYFAALPSARASADCGFRSVFTGGMNDFCQSVEELRELHEAIPKISGLTSFLLGFHAEYTTSLRRMEKLAALAQELKSPVWLHNAETRREVEECKGRWGKTPTELTDGLGMYAHGGGGYHCVYFEDCDFEIFQKRGLAAVTNPASNLKLASGVAPVKRFLDEGIRVAIGTDGAASNNSLDMFKEMFLVSGLAKARERDAACVPADKVLFMATAGGARAMGLADCDRLAEGKLADLVMIDLKQPNMQPEHHIVKNLVYAGSKQNVKLAMVNGNILYEDQEFFIGTEAEEVYRRANEIIRRIMA